MYDSHEQKYIGPSVLKKYIFALSVFDRKRFHYICPSVLDLAKDFANHIGLPHQQLSTTINNSVPARKQRCTRKEKRVIKSLASVNDDI